MHEVPRSPNPMMPKAQRLCDDTACCPHLRPQFCLKTRKMINISNRVKSINMALIELAVACSINTTNIIFVAIYEVTKHGEGEKGRLGMRLGDCLYSIELCVL